MKKSFIKFLFIGIIAFGIVSCTGKKNDSSSDKTVKTENTEVSENVPEQTKSSKVKTIIDFNATWCGPCQQFKPIFKELEKEYGDKITFKDVDVDQNQEMAIKWGVESIPTILFLDADGNEITREIGFRPKEHMVAVINKHL